MDRRHRKLLARHEAAHAIVAHVLGERVIRIAWGSHESQPGGAAYVVVECKDPLHHLLVFRAGELASPRTDSPSDRFWAGYLLRGPAQRHIGWALRQVDEVVKAILRKHARSIVTLARALEHCDVLEGEHLRMLLPDVHSEAA
jgi:hypothetical protein